MSFEGKRGGEKGKGKGKGKGERERESAREKGGKAKYSQIRIDASNIILDIVNFIILYNDLSWRILFVVGAIPAAAVEMADAVIFASANGDGA